MIHRLATYPTFVVVLVSASLAQAAEPPKWATPATAFLERHCTSCHSGEAADADLRLERLSQNLNDRPTLELWVRLFDKIAKHEMPPADAPQPTQAERDAVMQALTPPLAAADLEHQRTFGRTVLRRLNRLEYENTLRDLLAMPYLEVKESLPADSELDGFDTVGAALTMSYVQQDAYLKTAEAALERAAGLYLQPKVQTFQFGFTDPPPARPGRVIPPVPKHGLALLSNANLDPPSFMTNSYGARFTASGDGWYKIRFRARGATYDNREQGGGMDGTLTDSEVPHVVLLYAERPPFSRWLATFDLPRDRMGELKLTTWLNAGERIRRIHATLHESGQTYRPYERPFRGTVMALESFSAEGPHVDAWPPESHRRLFGDLPTRELPKTTVRPLPQASGAPAITLAVEPKDAYADTARLIAEFVPRAFRRQTPAAEIARYVAIAKQSLDGGANFQEALFAAYQAALCSPDFLYFQERPGRLDGEALANRLSYFLWRSPPDEALLQAGRDGRLRDPKVLQAEVERLLDDPRAERFVHDFTDQWLKLREINFTMADPDLYPEYHEDFELLDSLLREPRAYFTEMLQRNLGVAYVVDSDFVFVNRRLAKLYDLPEVDGTEIRKVALPPGHVRGGFLTQAGVLKVTANGTTTTPVVRGVWLMDRILGSPPPPPPADVPAIEPDLRGATTVRELLAKHRASAACGMCHARIDPPGFALESFDVLGGYRTHYRALGVQPVAGSHRNVKFKYGVGPAVECRGETAEGRRFEDIREFKKILLADQPRLARNLVERLITFSTGSPVQFGDRADVAAIVADLAESEYGLRSMIHAVVGSRMFQHK